MSLPQQQQRGRNMETRFVCTYTPTVRKNAEITRKLHPVRVIIRIVFAVAYFLYTLITALEFEFQDVFGLLFAFGVFLLVWSIVSPEINSFFAIRRSKKSMGPNLTREIVFGDSIEILEKTVKVVWEYSDIQQVKRLRNTYLLMKDKNMGIAIDPETFTEGNFYNFKKFLREKCPNIQIPE